MFRPLTHVSAVASLLSGLLAGHPANAQETPKIEIPHSIISLAPALRPHGQVVARNATDASFEHVPENYHVFAAATVGQDAGVELLTLNFDGATRLTKIQSKTKDFVVESAGTCHEGSSYSKGDSCALMVRFSPQGPGHRSGSINIANSAEAKPMFVGLAGNGYSPVVSFTPSQIVTVAGTSASNTGTIKSSTNLAVDGGDTLYIPDVGNKIIKEIDSSGTISTLSPVFAVPQSLVADSSGFLYSLNVTGSTYYFSYYAPYGSQSAYGTSYTAGSCTPSTPCPLTTVGMNRPANINIDPYDNLFFEEGTQGAAEMPVAIIAGGSDSLNLWYLRNQYVYSSTPPVSFAVDGSDTLYNFYNYGTTTCFLQSEPLYNAEYSPVAKKVAGGSACGFSGDGGQARSAEISKTVGQITFDVAGNLYFADAGNQRIRRIDASTGVISTIAGTGVSGYAGDTGAATAAAISNPTGLAVDSQGQVFILSNAPVAGPTQVIRKVNTTGYWNFGSQLKGTTSTTKLFTVANTGNSALTLAANAAISGVPDFAIDTTVTNCVLTAGSTLAAGQSCVIGIKFTPAVTGTRSSTLTLLDNTVAGANHIVLTGAGTLPAPKMSITSPTAAVKKGTTVTFAVSVAATTSAKPTGTVTFKVNGSNVGSVVTLSSTGTASTTFTESTAATYSLSAVYSGDANYSSATVSENLTVTASVKEPSTVSIAQAPFERTSCSSSPSFSVHVSSSGKMPTGLVQLMNGTTTMAWATLNNGVAQLSSAKMAGGLHTLVASYGGDSEHEPATSAPLSALTATGGAACPVPTPKM
ncbi:Ig-like domain repeat protein [Granulicella sibirica]|uniref:Glycoprotein gp2 n=1 Tax=Granulicella sibirica TaxID=2479048 RepID=A0A4V1L5M4_9BACT|nr:Ig-like domain repeat protein [Granulicella sibirica]RXH56274.1 Glycoprotein gp2 [Granulicella sibirica]